VYRPRPKPTAADEIAIAVIEQRPILNTIGFLSLDLGVEFLFDLGFGEFAASINERRDGGIAHNSIARGRSSMCHDRATMRPVLNFSISAVTLPRIVKKAVITPYDPQRNLCDALPEMKMLSKLGGRLRPNG
jgi:hypothetical protein